jgi:hypothetical protein
MDETSRHDAWQEGDSYEAVHTGRRGCGFLAATAVGVDEEMAGLKQSQGSLTGRRCAGTPSSFSLMALPSASST